MVSEPHTEDAITATLAHMPAPPHTQTHHTTATLAPFLLLCRRCGGEPAPARDSHGDAQAQRFAPGGQPGLSGGVLPGSACCRCAAPAPASHALHPSTGHPAVQHWRQYWKLCRGLRWLPRSCRDRSPVALQGACRAAGAAIVCRCPQGRDTWGRREVLHEGCQAELALQEVERLLCAAAATGGGGNNRQSTCWAAARGASSWMQTISLSMCLARAARRGPGKRAWPRPCNTQKWLLCQQ